MPPNQPTGNEDRENCHSPTASVVTRSHQLDNATQSEETQSDSGVKALLESNNIQYIELYTASPSRKAANKGPETGNTGRKNKRKAKGEEGYARYDPELLLPSKKRSPKKPKPEKQRQKSTTPSPTKSSPNKHNYQLRKSPVNFMNFFHVIVPGTSPEKPRPTRSQREDDEEVESKASTPKKSASPTEFQQEIEQMITNNPDVVIMSDEDISKYHHKMEVIEKRALKRESEIYNYQLHLQSLQRYS